MKNYLFLFCLFSCFAFGQVQGPRTGVPAGTATNPGLFFNTDTNTGLFSPGADQVNIATGGVNRLSVDASGNLRTNSIINLQGTGSPQATFGLLLGSAGSDARSNIYLVTGVTGATSAKSDNIIIQTLTETVGLSENGDISIIAGSAQSYQHPGNILIQSGNSLVAGQGNIQLNSTGLFQVNNSLQVGASGAITLGPVASVPANYGGVNILGRIGAAATAGIPDGYVGEEKRITQSVYTNNTAGGWDNLGSVSLTSGVWVPCIKATVISTGSTTFSDAVIFGYSSDSGATTFTDRDGTIARSKEVSMSFPGIGVSYSNYRFAAGGCMPAFSVASTTTYYFKALRVASAGNYDLIGSILTFTRK